MHGGLLIALLIEFSVNSIECFKHHIFIMLGVGTSYNVVNCSYSLICGTPVYPGIDWVTWPSYAAMIVCYIISYVAFQINYYFWKIVKLPRILKNSYENKI